MDFEDLDTEQKLPEKSIITNVPFDEIIRALDEQFSSKKRPINEVAENNTNAKKPRIS